MQQKVLPIRKGNRTTFNYSKQKKEDEKKRQKKKEEKEYFDYKVAMSSIGIEVYDETKT